MEYLFLVVLLAVRLALSMLLASLVTAHYN